jgi:hypothetical protein
MPKLVDVKSALIGGLAVTLAIGVIGAAPHVVQEAYGRFEIATNTDCAFVLDSATGQVWSLQTGVSGGIVHAPPHTTQEFFDPKIDFVYDPNDTFGL